MNELTTTGPAVPATQQNPFCRSCGQRVAAIDNFCGRCGTDCRELILVVDAVPPRVVGHYHQSMTSAGPTTNERALENSGIIGATLNNRWAVMGILAFTGPLGLLALWFSPRFSKPTKTLVTASYVLLTTVVPLVIAWYWLDVAVRPVLDAFNGRVGL